MSPTATIAITSYTLGAVSVDLVVSPDAPVGIVALRPAGVPAVHDRPGSAVNLVELGLLGDGRRSSASVRHEGLATGLRLRPVSVEQPEPGRLVIEQADESTGLVVTTELRVPAPDLAALAWTTTVTNGGSAPATLSYVSSAVVLGAGAVVDGPVLSDTTASFAVARNAWCAEARWLVRPLPECGLVDATVWPATSTTHGPREGARSRVLVAAYGTWSTSDFLPMGSISAGGSTWLWQVEHNGPWAYDLSDWEHDVSARLSGPNDTEHDWRHVLAPGASFSAVPATTVVTEGSLGDALRVLTTARRAGRRPHQDNVTLPVIFNDYMNCLMGDPTTEKLLPVIASAAAAGAEYFVIDAGWYSDDGGWWETVGEWLPSTQRFPDGGLKVVIDTIHDAGMVPGLWLEPEVIGVRSPLAKTLPDDAFFTVDGIRLTEAGRHQLDFRHPAVIAHLNETVDRLVGEFGIGYFKFDYNINPGHGTTVDAASRGDGLLGHNRAFLAWVDDVMDRHPGLVLENCSSGGCRMEYGQLSHFPIQSTSDQMDPLRYASISAGVASAVAPEQSATWAYPLPSNDDETNALCLVNALLGRIHLSGRLDLCDDRQRGIVEPAIAVYKSYRERLATALPSWPLGLPGWDDAWVALGMDQGADTWIAVWRRGGDDSVRLPGVAPAGAEVEVLFPAAGSGLETTLTRDGDDLIVELPSSIGARLIHIGPDR